MPPVYIAVMSGKGGVGKTTTSVNLAVALARLTRQRVGLLDLDIYGPNTHLVLGLPEVPPGEDTRSGKLAPALLKRYNLEYMSVATVFPEGVGLALKADYVLDIVRTYIEYTEWGSRVVVVDMPPGSQDVVNFALRLMGRRARAVIVIEPHRFAAADSLRLIDIVRHFEVPVRALVVNKANLFPREMVKSAVQELVEKGGIRGARIVAVPWDTRLMQGPVPDLFYELAQAVL